MPVFAKAIAALVLSALAPMAMAAPAAPSTALRAEQAVANTNHILRIMDGVDPDWWGDAIEQFGKGAYPLKHKDMPIWILNTKTEAIMYYQGQDSFKGQPAAQLVDEQGQRFGQKALTAAKRSKNLWMNLVLGGAVYRAYCGSISPIVACSLIPDASPLPGNSTTTGRS